MTRYTLHVPELLNDGQAVSSDMLDLIEAEILDVSGGFTRTDAVGAWKSPDGVIYREPMLLYAVDSDDPETAGKLHHIARMVRSMLAQEAVYLTHAPIGTALVGVTA